MNRSLPCLLMICLLLTGCHTPHKSGTVKSEINSNASITIPTKDCKEVTAMRKKIVAEARNWVGTRYCYGGKSRNGTDCSGMVMTIFDDVAQLKLPRNSAKQQEFCKALKQKELMEADLLFFSTSKKGARVNHVGIYIGDGKFVHASTSKGVIVSSLDEPYYVRHYHSSGRVPGLAVKTKAPEKAVTVTTSDPGVVEDSVAADSIAEEVRRAMKW